MKKVVLLAVFFICMSNVWAEFKYIGEDEHIQYYVDTETIKRVNNQVKYWELRNQKSPKKIGNFPSFQSSKSIQLEDCDLETHQDIYVVFYSELNGSGDNIFTLDSAGKVTPIVPGTTGARLHNFVCNFKKQR